jgi:hypothetical protein
MINLYVKKALCYIQIGDIQKFKIEQAKAEEGYQKLRSGGGQDKQDKEDFNFVDMFKNVPNEILWAKILQLRAIFELLQGNFQTAAGILTEIVDLGEHYDPEVRDFCLVLLENIFKLFNLPTKPLKQFKSYISINVFEVVMLIDYSKEMTTE